MKFLFSVLIIGLFSPIGLTQNLVRNNSFEYFDSTVSFLSSIVDWNRYQTVDYYSEINSVYVWQIPCTPVGCQYSKNGIAHIGLYLNANNTSNYREYIQSQLLQPLDSGQKYCVSFYISRSDTMEYASKDWGILLTDTIVVPPPSPTYLVNALAQVTVPYFVTDDDNWTLIQQIYTPASPNQYITIGNFLDDSVFPQQFVQSSCAGCKQSYYYIDDVSVSLIRNPVLSNDTIIYYGESIIIGDTAQDAAQYFWSPTTGLSDPNSWQTLASPVTTTTYALTKITSCDTTESSIKIEVLAKENDLTILPNPNDGNFQINYNLMEDAEFVIYDALGRKVHYTKLLAGSNILFTPELNTLATAMYVLALEKENGEQLFQTKMVVND